ncbi:Lanosterol 14-alpha-demethylase [Mycena chlorophos]|uniref:Lanosterol 14-alpha-demethylase n=1 Tax=Mycena chlorophos TaxID=658473 RepID=A0A8H6WFH1_MYCCL|nr:Lanosterol 14-alpha-demethylase [Mycena chlorophos]
MRSLVCSLHLHKSKAKPPPKRQLKFNERSPSPVEEFEDNGQSWGFKIVGEEVGIDNEMRYEVEWVGWSRPDGTNTTWETSNSLDVPLPTKEWEKQRKAALRSTEDGIELPVKARNLATWMRLYDTKPSNQESYQAKVDRIMARQKHLAEEYAASKASAAQSTTGTAPPVPAAKPSPASRNNSTKAVAGPASIHARGRPVHENVNAEAGPSRIRLASRPISISSDSDESVMIIDPPSPKVKRPPTLTPRLPSTPGPSTPGPSTPGPPTPRPRIPTPSPPRTFSRTASGRFPSEASTSTMASPSTSRTPSMRNAPPSSVNLRKRKASPVLERVCANGCGSPLAPPDVCKRDVCDTCFSTRAQRVWKKSKKEEESRESSRLTDAKRETSASAKPALGSRRGTSTKTDSVGGSGVLKAPLPSRKGKERATVKSGRVRMETGWSEAASAATEGNAAGITFANDVDEEELPSSIPPDFEYLEDAYVYSETLSEVPQLRDFFDPESQKLLTPQSLFTFCDCRSSEHLDGSDCVDRACCGCQIDNGDLGYAYTEGLFNFTYESSEVIVECNAFCRCSEQCPNRVAQRPRIIPIEIFKTASCGWGVRSSVDVEKGRVLGVYTGKLIRRCEAEELTGFQKEFCFDLDYQDDGQDEDGLLSIDASHHGNWTRFINHSCDPNLRVQPVVYDTISEQNAGYLAFIAGRFIEAGTEFRFDYDPQAAAEVGKSTKGSKSKDKQRCHCGAKSCRKYLW